jgi:hypothetical protein
VLRAEDPIASDGVVAPLMELVSNLSCVHAAAEVSGGVCVFVFMSVLVPSW